MSVCLYEKRRKSFPQNVATVRVGGVFGKKQPLPWTNAGGPSRGWAVPGRRARPGQPMFDLTGRGPARPIEFSEDGPRPGPGHDISKNSRPGPAHHFLKRLGPGRPGSSHGSEAHETRALPDTYVGQPTDLPFRPMCCSVPKRTCTHYADMKY